MPCNLNSINTFTCIEDINRNLLLHMTLSVHGDAPFNDIKLLHNGTRIFYSGFIPYKDHEIISDTNKNISYEVFYLKELYDRNSEITCPKCSHNFLQICSVSNSLISIKDVSSTHTYAICNIKQPQFKCPHCGKHFLLKTRLRICAGKITYRLFNEIAEQFRTLKFSIRSIAKKYNIYEGLAKKIFNYTIMSYGLNIDYSKVFYIGIDEHSIHKGHKYACTIVDLDTKRILYVCDGKKKEDIQPFFDKLKENNLHLQIKGFSCDCCPAFIALAKENLPNAKIILDEFHILQMFSKDINKVRQLVVKIYRLICELFKKLSIDESNRFKRDQTTIKKIREKLHKLNVSDDKINYFLKDNDYKKSAILLNKKAENINKGLNYICLGKKEFLKRSINNEIKEAILDSEELVILLEEGDQIRKLYHPNVSYGNNDQLISENIQRLDNICSRLKKLCVTQINNFCDFLQRRKDQIIYGPTLNFHISNSIVEGINSQLKVLQRVFKGKFSHAIYIMMAHMAFPGKPSVGLAA